MIKWNRTRETPGWSRFVQIMYVIGIVALIVAYAVIKV